MFLTHGEIVLQFVELAALFDLTEEKNSDEIIPILDSIKFN